MSRSINSSFFFFFFLSREGKELLRGMKEEATSHPWHRSVPGLQHAETCHASSSDTVNLQAQKSPTSTAQTCASRFFISVFTQGFGCLSGAENRHLGKGVLGETRAAPWQRAFAAEGGAMGSAGSVPRGGSGQGVDFDEVKKQHRGSTVRAPHCCRELCDGAATTWFGHNNVPAISQSPRLWQGLLFHPPTGDGKVRIRTLCDEPFSFIRLSRHQNLPKCYNRTM